MTSTPTTSTLAADGLVHAALLYRHPEQLRLALAEFVRDAVAAQEAILVVLPSSSLEALGDALDAARDHLTVQDMSDVGRNPARLIPMLLRWLGEQAGQCRVVSESLWPQRSYAEASECLRHEALLNHALCDETVNVLCPFDAEHLDAELLAGAELTHPQLIDEAGARPSVTYGDPLELALGRNWPQAPAPAEASELSFDGDLWQLRHALAADPLLEILAPERRDDLVFAVNEAASNALRHGDGRVDARVWREDGRVVGEVRSTSTIDDPLAGRRTPEIDDVGGRGLWLINQVCDLVEVRSATDGASVRMHVNA